MWVGVNDVLSTREAVCFASIMCPRMYSFEHYLAIAAMNVYDLVLDVSPERAESQESKVDSTIAWHVTTQGQDCLIFMRTILNDPIIYQKLKYTNFSSTYKRHEKSLDYFKNEKNFQYTERTKYYFLLYKSSFQLYCKYIPISAGIDCADIARPIVIATRKY